MDNTKVSITVTADTYDQAIEKMKALVKNHSNTVYYHIKNIEKAIPSKTLKETRDE